MPIKHTDGRRAGIRPNPRTVLHPPLTQVRVQTTDPEMQ